MAQADLTSLRTFAMSIRPVFDILFALDFPLNHAQQSFLDSMSMHLIMLQTLPEECDHSLLIVHTAF
jgi:hypothetical protein